MIDTIDPIIQTENLSKELDGKVIIHNESFYVPRGSIFGFIGPSGSGKTTTIRMLTGYYQPTSGKVHVFGVSPDKFSHFEREKIGYLPQLFSLYPDLTVWENLNFAASIYGLPLIRKQQLMEILQFVELTEDRHKLARQLSGGMQRRLNLAATLVHNPDLIFMDEPTAGADPVLRLKFWDHFRTLRSNGHTLFITTQYVSEAAYCDLVGVINEGRLITVKEPNRLRHQVYGGDLVDLRLIKPWDYESLVSLNGLPFVQAKARQRDDFSVRMIVNEANTDMAALLEWAKGCRLEVDQIEEYLPPFDDVFVELVKARGENG
jgi:ABC-2 type transport system ATP-binding protein